MKEKQSKKIFTRMLMNNWGGISHKVMEFHEYVNLFSGKSGSGKSTVMDAIQVVLYGSISSTFLNKAADDAKNRRSVLSYLRGAQKDGSFNREDQDFCSQIVLEIKDTGKNTHTCIGVSFEVGKADTDIRKYCFFSHSGKIPEDEYLTEEGVPYTIAKLKKLVEARIESADNRGRGDVNRVYPSKEAYLKTVYDAIFGYVEPGRMMTMEKSAIALRMTNGTGQFIKDYMFPKSKEDTVATISDQLGAYREIKERVEDLEQRIKMLDEISQHNLALQKARADKIYVEQILKYIEIENCKAHLQSKEDDLQDILKKIEEKEEKRKSYLAEKDAKAAYRHKKEINRLLAKIKFSDSIYQIDIIPAQNENGQFYEMLTAPELDSKVFDDYGFEGQLSLGEDEFYQKYEEDIKRLTEKFMPPKEEDARSLSQYRQQMEQYVDYRNYLTFSMYEKVEDENGNIRKNAVDDMAGRDSGGEGQNPKYVALLAGFAMLYMQQTNRDSKIRLVLLDEAFSKMDKERSEVCLHYARELELQLIVCVPDERLQSLIRNVDCVYGFRRHQNQVSMMHIDKGDYLDMVEGNKE